MSETSIVTPGESVGDAENWQAGEGVTAIAGKLVATTLGEVNFNSDENTVNVPVSYTHLTLPTKA